MTSASAPVIAVNSVSKWYGSVVAVNDVTLGIEPGITGLLGPNGAGKTTLLKMIEGLAAPSDGTVTIFGESPRNNPSLFRRVGVMSEHEAVYGFQTGRQFVEWSAKLHGVTTIAEATALAIERVGLADATAPAAGHVLARHAPTHAAGSNHRARAGGHHPRRALNGTDPRQRIEFHDLMRRLAAEGCTILISSHILEEVETLADRILLMVSGKLAASGDYRAIRAKLDEQPYNVRIVSSDPRRMAAALVELESIESVSLGADNDVIVLSKNVAVLQRSLAPHRPRPVHSPRARGAAG